MYSQNCHKAPQKKNERFQKLGEALIFKDLSFPSEKNKRKNP
jgi:hypothetical protein